MDVQPAPAVEASVGSANTQPAATSNVNAAPSAQLPVDQTQPNTAPQQPQQTTIAPAIAKLFNDAIPQPVDLHVSYRVEGHDVVTVFTDPNTGKEVTQIPSEALLDLAKFFDQQSGVTFDKNA